MEKNGMNGTLKGSWLDENGKRWTKVLFDVMADGGRRFVRQVSVTLGLHMEFGSGTYALDVPLHELGDEIVRQYPSLGGVRRPQFVPTKNRV